jgi:mannose-6-phosphate isomerase-like protein (cupin superfamily)
MVSKNVDHCKKIVALGFPGAMETGMETRTPAIVDLGAEAAKLTALLDVTPQPAAGKRRGRGTQLSSYREGILFLGASAGTGPGHWETHPEDEMVHILEGTRTLEVVCDEGAPKSFELRAGMLAVVPRGAWHRFHSRDFGMVLSATIPGDHVELDVSDPRPHAPVSPGEGQHAGGRPIIVDLSAEIAKLTMFRRRPQSTAAERTGSVANLAPYRDGLLLAIKASGTDHWERHLAGDELVHILDGSATLEIVCDDGPPKSFELRRGTVAVIPQGAWHRLLSLEGATQMAVTPFPGETLEVDVDDPRTAAGKPA